MLVNILCQHFASLEFNVLLQVEYQQGLFYSLKFLWPLNHLIMGILSVLKK